MARINFGLNKQSGLIGFPFFILLITTILAYSKFSYQPNSFFVALFFTITLPFQILYEVIWEGGTVNDPIIIVPFVLTILFLIARRKIGILKSMSYPLLFGYTYTITTLIYTILLIINL